MKVLIFCAFIAFKMLFNSFNTECNSIRYLRVAKLADDSIADTAPWLKSGYNNHSSFYFYKKQLLLKLKSGKEDKISVVESYDAQSGVIVGMIWSSIDSINFIVSNGLLKYNFHFPISKNEKDNITKWENSICVDSQNANNSLHSQALVIQQYYSNNKFRFCIKKL